VSVAHEARVEAELRPEIKPTRERPRINREVLVDHESARAVGWGFPTVATYDPELHRAGGQYPGWSSGVKAAVP